MLDRFCFSVVRRCALIGMGLAASLTVHAAPDATLNATTSEPRAFGYHVGDLVERDITVHVPDGLKLDEASMPRPGARGKALELQKVSRRDQSESGGLRHELRLTYQVFMSPPDVRTLEIAAFSLHFTGTPRDQDLRVEAWPVTVSPLVPVDPSPREGLGDLRPDRLPPAIDTGPTRWRLIAYGLVLLLLLAYLAQVYVAAPWWSQRRRPFAQAWRQLRGLPPQSDAATSRVAFQRVHDALNQTAGEVLFENGIDRFLAAQPRYASLRPELLRFFQQSRREFFGQAARAANDASWLVEFCRQCRDAERGAA